MEDIKKLLAYNDDSTMSSFEDNDSDNEELTIWNLETSSKKVELVPVHSNLGVKNVIIKRNGEERLPTRKPDPNVYNRNALLARENRRKKKMYLEMIEKELHDARKANRALMKALKRQLKVGQRLEAEKKYFQSLIANRSDILSLVSALNIRRPPSESNNSVFLTSSSFGNENTSCLSEDPTTTNSGNGSSYDLDPLCTHFDNLSDGSVNVENQYVSSDFSSFDFCTFPDFFTDLEDANSIGLPISSSWDDIWNNRYNGASNDLLLPGDSLKIIHDHCYVTANATSSNHIKNSHQQSEPSSTSIHSESSLDFDVGTGEIFVGFCSHNADSKVSVGYCPSCRWNLTSRTPPLQLLNDESFD